MSTVGTVLRTKYDANKSHAELQAVNSDSVSILKEMWPVNSSELNLSKLSRPSG